MPGLLSWTVILDHFESRASAESGKPVVVPRLAVVSNGRAPDLRDAEDDADVDDPPSSECLTNLFTYTLGPLPSWSLHVMDPESRACTLRRRSRTERHLWTLSLVV